MTKGKLFLIIIALAIIGFFVYSGIQSGFIHLYFSDQAEEKIVLEENYTKYSSGDVNFNNDEVDSTFEMSITLENSTEKLLAYADRKSFSFPNNYMIIQLLDEEKNHLSECRVRSEELCSFGENFPLSAGEYFVQFI